MEVNSRKQDRGGIIQEGERERGLAREERKVGGGRGDSGEELDEGTGRPNQPPRAR